MLNGAIQFVEPEEMGCPPDSDDAVAICARLGASDAPVDVGWFIHHVRVDASAGPRCGPGSGWAVRTSPCARRPAWPPGRCVRSRRGCLAVPEASGRNLLVHCAQEMNHLAGFLPELYEAFGDE